MKADATVGPEIGGPRRDSTARTVTNDAARSPTRLFGDGLAASFGADAPAPSIVTQSIPQAHLAVTEVRVDSPAGRLSESLPGDNAYLVCYQLRTFDGMEYWENGRHLTTYGMHAGESAINDLRREPQVKFELPIHCILWLVPQAALDVLADEANVQRIDGLRCAPGVGLGDETLRHLNLAAISALQASGQVNRLFVDHLNLALAAHVAEAYGGMEMARRRVDGGLAPWQERRAKEMLLSDLTGATPLAEIARASGLSPTHFARAFRKSTGLAPHAWLLTARVEHAMTLLRRPGMSLSEIALACGFADHSHFTRVFGRKTGQSPSEWRRVAPG